MKKQPTFVEKLLVYMFIMVTTSGAIWLTTHFFKSTLELVGRCS